MINIDASIFKAYDIRGIVDKNLNSEVAERIGKAFGSAALEAGEKVVAVGRDGRLSGPELSHALINGLLSTGVDVLDVGMVTSPMLYFAAHQLCQSGIQVTGSHNPKNYNGFKMVLAGKSIHGEEIQALYQRIINHDFVIAENRGRRTQVDIFEPYKKAVQESIKLIRPIKVVIDCGNGVTGASTPEVLKAIGCDVVSTLYPEVDGNFPNHHPDPSKSENLQDLKQEVARTGAELGLAFDGDGDRLGVITADGEEIYPDRQLILFAQDVLNRNPGASIVYDVKCTQQMDPAIKKAGGVPYMTTTGHSLVKAKMAELKAPLAGEMSGHIFFQERWFGFDDATYSAARLLEILSASNDPSRVLNALPKAFSTPEINIACPGDNAHVLAQKLKEVVEQQPELTTSAKVTTIDGVRIDWEDGFGLIRASNTTPVLVLRFEGQTMAALERIQEQMLALLSHVLPDVQLPSGAVAH